MGVWCCYMKGLPTVKAARRWLYLDGVEGGNEQSSVQAAEVGDEAWSEEEQGHWEKHPAVSNIVGKHLPTRPNGRQATSRDQRSRRCDVGMRDVEI